jgi:hypothetical protein
MPNRYESDCGNHIVYLDVALPYVRFKVNNREIICYPTDGISPKQVSLDEQLRWHRQLDDIAREYKEKQKRLDAERARKIKEEEAKRGKPLSTMELMYGIF